MVARADEELAHAHEQITRAHEEIGRTEEQLSELQHDVARQPSDHPQSRMNTFRPAVPSNPPSLGRRAVRAFISLALLGCIGVAAMAWQSPSSGDAAKQMIAEMGAAARPDFIADASKSGAPRATGATCRSGERGVGSTSTTSTSGSGRTARRRAARRRPVARNGAAAPVDGARSRNRGAKNRAAQGQHRSAQGQPATNVPRQSPNLPRARLPSRTCGPRHQRLRHGRLPLRRASPCRRSRRRKPQRSRRPKKRSCHRCRGHR